MLIILKPYLFRPFGLTGCRIIFVFVFFTLTEPTDSYSEPLRLEAASLMVETLSLRALSTDFREFYSRAYFHHSFLSTKSYSLTCVLVDG